MHHEQRNSRCTPIPGRCDQPAANDAPNAFQNQCAHGIQKSRLTLRLRRAHKSAAPTARKDKEGDALLCIAWSRWLGPAGSIWIYLRAKHGTDKSANHHKHQENGHK